MEYNYILNTAVPQKEKLLKFGFRISNNEKDDSETLIYKTDIHEGQFFVVIRLELNTQKMSAEVWEKATDEKYMLFDVPSAHGSFVGKIRTEVQSIIDEICRQCFIHEDVHKKYVNFLSEFFGVHGDNPWASEDGNNPTDEDYAVFRCPNKKWFALIMKIKFKQLGFIDDASSEESLWVVNLKADPKIIPSIVDKKSIFPAYHMNKKNWITVLLTSVTNFEKLCELTKKSFELVF